jgi:hypothetical protein
MIYNREQPFSKRYDQTLLQVCFPEGISPYNPDYMIYKQSHSEKVQIWQSFAANGIGAHMNYLLII